MKFDIAQVNNKLFIDAVSREFRKVERLSVFLNQIEILQVREEDCTFFDEFVEMGSGETSIIQKQDT